MRIPFGVLTTEPFWYLRFGLKSMAADVAEDGVEQALAAAPTLLARSPVPVLGLQQDVSVSAPPPPPLPTITESGVLLCECVCR